MARLSSQTSVAAEVIADAVERGGRVAVTANSHKVITNLLAKAAEVLARRGVDCGVVKVVGSPHSELSVGVWGGPQLSRGMMGRNERGDCPTEQPTCGRGLNGI